jgi:hypothetical protein
MTSPSAVTGAAASTSRTAQPSQVAVYATGKKTDVGAIVGPIVAVVLVLALAAFAALRWRKCRLRAQDSLLPQSFPHDMRPGVWHKGQEANVASASSGFQTVIRQNTKGGIVISTQESASVSSTLPSVTESSNSNQVRRIPNHSHQPSTAAPALVNPPSSVPMVDVNQIVELITQRIDPRSHAPVDDAPPRYPTSLGF